ncbi:hypothetical protein L207DRAFT_519704 [Hyaloscypha variabilis F]|uniref:Uncharacterized protein n=1 Tax=Hyaloscypha variabilis (strain UAMH 11265 / GT02V1 / F) TaxID=1149755 RepID=A0A2J6QXR3_HYAVF|nr:hypothetical protein L207DRAFT_519704 [Hyaloscypha variabilis F]
MWHHRNLAPGGRLEHDLDLVAAFPSPPFEAVLVPGKDYRSSALRPRLSYENAGEPLTLDLLWRLLRSQGADHTSPYAKTCSIAFQADGKIYFVPQKARVGDIICSFSTELYTLVRMDTNSRVGSVLGRCLEFLPPGIRTEVNRPIISLGQIQIQFDLRTLHLQTRVSERECLEAN